jgi:hypothetical protein
MVGLSKVKSLHIGDDIYAISASAQLQMEYLSTDRFSISRWFRNPTSLKLQRLTFIAILNAAKHTGWNASLHAAWDVLLMWRIIFV